MTKKIITLLLSIFILSSNESHSQTNYIWTSTNDGIYRDGEPFYLQGQSWSKKTDFTYKQGFGVETEVKDILTDLHEIGINVIRIYGSPDENDWSVSSNYHNLIRWIEEWNSAHPDKGDPNKAMYYMVQISPKDPQSIISGDLPVNTEESFHRAINDLSNPGSVASMIQDINGITSGSRYLLSYLIYHELNVSSKYLDWQEKIGADGIEKFMNVVADSIHLSLAPGKLVSHTGDAKDSDPDIYSNIESLDQISGNVFEKFDILGFNLYSSTNSLLEENSYYQRIVKRRSFSVNQNRGWFIGETGASYDKEANPVSVALANYTNPQGGAHLQLMWHKSEELGNMAGIMLFTVQDNDKQVTSNFNAMKQRGYFDYYGDKKFLYYIYPDIANKISTNSRSHSTDSHDLKLLIKEDSFNYTVNFYFRNKTDTELQFRYSIYGDDGGSSKQHFSIEKHNTYLTLHPGEEREIKVVEVIPPTKSLLAVTATVIQEFIPNNPYLWGREHILADAICTVAGLNQNLENLPEEPLSSASSHMQINQDLVRGLVVFHQGQAITIPKGRWQLQLYNLKGGLLYMQMVEPLARRSQSSDRLMIDSLFPGNDHAVAIYILTRISF